MLAIFEIRADPDPIIDDAADMLGELAVDRRPDGANWLIEEHSNRQLRGAGTGTRHAADRRRRAAQ